MLHLSEKKSALPTVTRMLSRAREVTSLFSFFLSHTCSEGLRGAQSAATGWLNERELWKKKFNTRTSNEKKLFPEQKTAGIERFASNE